MAIHKINTAHAIAIRTAHAAHTATTRKYFIFLTIIFLLMFSACARTKSDTSFTPMSATEQSAPPKTGEQIATIQTSKGTIKMKFFPEQAPETVKNFTELAKKEFYDGLIFHRVIPDFMIQGGDPLGTGTGGETYKGPGTTIPGEVSPKLSHINGAVAMANKCGDPGTATSQFYIVSNPAGVKVLDGGYTIFGQVYEGQDVVDAIAAVDRDTMDKPNRDIVMQKITIETAK